MAPGAASRTPPRLMVGRVGGAPLSEPRVSSPTGNVPDERCPDRSPRREPDGTSRVAPREDLSPLRAGGFLFGEIALGHCLGQDREKGESMDTKFLLPEKDLPTAWYNIQADLPEPLPPVLPPGTKAPVGPPDLAPLFPLAL